MYQHGNTYLSYAKLRHLIKTNQPYTVTSNDFPVIDIPLKNYKKYYIGIEKLINYLVIDGGTVNDSKKQKTFPSIVKPKSFDGVLTMKNGKKFNAKENSQINSVYKFIYEDVSSY